MKWDIRLHQTSWWLCPDSPGDAWVARGQLEGLEKAWPPVGHFFFLTRFSSMSQLPNPYLPSLLALNRLGARFTPFLFNA